MTPSGRSSSSSSPSPRRRRRRGGSIVPLYLLAAAAASSVVDAAAAFQSLVPGTAAARLRRRRPTAGRSLAPRNPRARPPVRLDLFRRDDDDDDDGGGERESEPPRKLDGLGEACARSLRSSAVAALLLCASAALCVPAPLSASDLPIPESSSSSSSTMATTALTTFSPASDPEVRASQLSQPRKKLRYWTIMGSSDRSAIMSANEALLDFAVGTVNTMYYDNSGGARFNPRSFYGEWRALRTYARDGQEGLERLRARDANLERLLRSGGGGGGMPADAFGSREGAVAGLKWLISTLDDPYSAYLTREELWDELTRRDDGFLGLGAVVEPPQRAPLSLDRQRQRQGQGQAATSAAAAPVSGGSTSAAARGSRSGLLSATRVANLPIVTAVSPDSPAERAGIAVGDRIVAVGSDKFLGMSRDLVERKLSKYRGAENYVGTAGVTVAKPVVRTVIAPPGDDADAAESEVAGPRRRYPPRPRDVVIGYRPSRVRLATSSMEPFRPRAVPTYADATQVFVGDYDALVRPHSDPVVSGGDGVVHYELLTPSGSILGRTGGGSYGQGGALEEIGPVGYIRLTRFSRASTDGYLRAVEALERAGAGAYIVDVRNNYGGVIQESMLTASTLLRDPHAVLCYTLNSRGGFTPHDVEEYAVDKRYPGYLLSSEPRTATLDQVRADDPQFLEEGEGGGVAWVPPSSYASLHEQGTKRGIRRPSSLPPSSSSSSTRGVPADARAGLYGGPTAPHPPPPSPERAARKPLVILINEGTASSAEVFASALRDNGRTVALVGTRTYGKGLIQHTVPLPDGGGLRLTVAEYLTPALRHVTDVGGARYDAETGEMVGGGIRPDVHCGGAGGIPSDVGADLCVGVALDALEEESRARAAAGVGRDGGDVGT